VHYNEHRNPKNYYRELLLLLLLLFIPLFDNEHTFKGDHSTWTMAYNVHDIQINLLLKTFLYNFDNNNAYITNWESIESQALELATKNDTNIWMDKFPNVNIGFSSQNIFNCIGVEPYNICNEYIINSCIGVSTIFNSTNIDVQDQIMPTHEFHSLLQEMNNECEAYRQNRVN
jgi:hypothetical protein